MRTTDKIAGILGGMGPQATVELMQRVIDATPAHDDSDHVHMIVDNNPKVPSRLKALVEGTGKSPAPVLAKMAKRLEAAGADFLAMPCNTAHAYLFEINAAVSIPVLDMINLTVDHVADIVGRGGKAGLMASPAVVDLELYHVPLAKRGVEVVCPSQTREILLEIIRMVKRGETGSEPRELLKKAAGQMEEAGAGILIIACTELSVLTDSMPTVPPYIDALDILAKSIVRFGV